MEKKGIKPDIISFNALVIGYLTKGDDDGFKEIIKTFMAEELLDVMVSKGIQPNLTNFSTIIGGFSREGDVDSMIRMFKKMKVMKRRNEM
ncbi:pentatricopeptide repeat-containing protein [Canna indica]|uniref:Pentatricopeptide repeat-containing protein n=1 Tax=Canna indica TaxID=4628 RepID=A0AAQ3Q3M1_9LILI|nr:pentatricopeptide repeat-containing protein [Canna indica]